MVHLRKIIIVVVVLILTFVFVQNSYGQTVTPTPTPTTTQSTSNSRAGDLQKMIDELQKKVTELSTQRKTLNSQITVMDSQIKLTQLRIDAKKQEIAILEEDIDTSNKKINNLEGSLTNLTKVLVNRIVATYQIGGGIQPLQIVASSGGVGNYLDRVNYLKLVQEHDKKLIYETQQAKMDYANQKQIFEDKKGEVEQLKKQLEGYTAKLDEDKGAKQKLLVATQNDEQKYQELLAKARAEYQAIQGIVAGNGAEVEVGPVSEGSRIASVIAGPSCNSGGAHLHFIVRRGGSTEDPFAYLSSISSRNCSGSSCDSSDGDSFNPRGSWRWPLEGPIEMSQGYGSTWAVRNSWVGQIYNFHNGIDIRGSSYEVKAVKSGTLYQGSYAGGGGCRLPYVRVKHTDDGLDTLYLHVNY